MGLVDDFPNDPFTPRLPYAAAAQLPVSVPWGWGDKVIPIGMPLTVGREPQDAMFLEGACAFSSESLKNSSLAFRSAARGMIADTSTHTAAGRQEHTSFSLQVKLGGSVIGVSGRANYEVRAAANQNVCLFPTVPPHSA
jgi:hypothetical protein